MDFNDNSENIKGKIKLFGIFYIWSIFEEILVFW